MTETTTDRSLIASINGATVGVLHEEDGIWSFQYDQAWLARADAFPISPGLPLKSEKIVDQGSKRPVQWFCDNLLPEELAREVLAKDAGVEIDDAWGLLAYFGSESAGAITLLPPDADSLGTGVRPLPNDELQRRINQMPRRSLSADSPKRMSLAGAQHKLAVSIQGGQLMEPLGAECSTHILKPDSKADGYPHTAINEHFCMQLAKSLDLPVPNTELRYVPWPIYLVERFDRERRGEQLLRLHTLDALQLLSLDRRLKYQKASAESLLACIKQCRTGARARQDIFRWTLFNVLIGNADAHLKNASFFISADGVTLAPFYDLVSTVVYTAAQFDQQGPHWPEATLSMPIGKARRYSEIQREDLLVFAEEINLRPQIADRHLKEMLAKILPSAERLIAEISPRAHAGEQRILQMIYHLPLKEMVAKLAKSKA
jgi:serine/threonine-protein kinase HipA